VRFTVDSLHRFNRAVDRSMERHGRATATALMVAGLYIQRESQKIVPVDTGFLRGSAFTRAEGKGFACVVSVGYEAYYAIYVHENLTNYHRPPTRAKYLESVLLEKNREINRITQNAFIKDLSHRK
jgi:hypothetical protein